ncbi:hypothetical protein AX17_002000 [Amanita inopinata Kibby_2008]|nr:hypothetical protein AX17_002000 [Amanita inopinata Kibby_2008]
MLQTYSPVLMHQQQQAQQQAQPQQQQQQPQQQQQQPPDAHPSLPNFSDNNRLWQQAQHVQQMRSHAPDLNSVQSNQQLAELFRNQAMARLQQSQQQMNLHQQQSQQFPSGVGMPQMATTQSMSGQQQPFQDLAANQPQQSHMPPVGFSAMSNANVNINHAINPVAGPSLQSRNTLLQNFSRQYELVAQNQQLQNGPINFNNRQQGPQPQLAPQPPSQQQPRDQQHMQSQAINHTSTADIFPSPNIQTEALRRSSPPHPSIPSQHISANMMRSSSQQPALQNQSVPASSLPVNQRPIHEQMLYLRNVIRQIEISIQRASVADTDPMTKARAIASLGTKKDAMNKMLTQLQTAALANMQASGGSSQMSWMLQQQQSSHQQQGSAQPSFDTLSMQRTGMGMQGQPPLPQGQLQQLQNPNMNPSPLIQHSQTGQIPIQNGASISSNSSSLPSTHANVGGSPFLTQTSMSSNTNSPFNFQMNAASLSGGSLVQQHQPPSQQQQVQRTVAVQSSGLPNQMLQMIPPLEKASFDHMFKSYCNSKQVKIDSRLLSVNNRPIDLHALHTFVLREGGEAKVQQKDLWSIIGGRMGFVQFPGTETEPTKSGPAIAQQLEHIYRQYLANFDRAYIASVLDSRIKSTQAPFNVTQLNLMITMADQPIHQLRAQGFSEQMIQFMESHRAHLQRARIERDGFHEGVKPMTGEQSSQVNSNIAMQPGNPFTTSQGLQNVLRQPPFVQAVQSGAQVGGHIPEGRQEVPQHSPPHVAGDVMINRPAREQIQAALTFIAKIRQETVASIDASRPQVTVAAEQRLEYSALIDQVHRQASDIEKRLAMLLVYTRREDFVRRIVIISVTVYQQRNMLASGNPRFFLSIENLRMMTQQIQQATEMCTHLFNALSQQQKLQQLQHQQPQGPQQSQATPLSRPSVNARNPFTTPEMSQPRAPGVPAQLQTPNVQPSQHLPQQPLSAPMSLQQPPSKRKPTPAIASGAQSTPSPAPASAHTPVLAALPNASTPGANAPTPALPSPASPQAPKSPKGKAPVKPKQTPVSKQRRPSKVAPPAALLEPPARVATPNASVKRPREDDDDIIEPAGTSPGRVNTVVNEPSPPKRIKTEWENPPNEDFKKAEVEEKIETTDDANLFLEQVSELLRKAADTEGQESTLSADISETLGMILKGCTSVPEAPENGLPSVSIGESTTGRDSPPPSTGFRDAFEEFIDYSFGQQDGQLDDDEGSKAHTPDLVSSSTNLSPESNTDGEIAQASTAAASLSDIKKEDYHDLRLGLWKEFDGGESAYYQPFEWKWDSPMPVLDQSWAVSTS